MTHERFATFVPGAAGLGSFWSPVLERLPRTWRTQLLDLPGLGPVPSSPTVSSYDDLVDYVARTIATPTILVGQSMGAFISLQLALRYPHLVTHLVLVALTGGVNLRAHGASEWRDHYSTSYPSAAAWARDEVPDLSERLGAITIPVLLFWATQDVLSPISVARTLSSRLPLARLVTIESDDHWVARQHPDAMAKAIRSLIE